MFDKIRPKHLMHFATILIAALATSPEGYAQSYPSKPIRLVLPYPPGGGSDVIARPLAPKLSERLGQQVVVDNRGGGGGNIAMEIVAKAPPDGYTIVLALAAQLAVNVSLYKDLPYDPLRDFTPISHLAEAPYMLAVHPSVPAKTVKEFIALAKAKPGQLNYGSTGNGGGPHLSMELLKALAQIDLVHVPYKGGGPAIPDFLAGRLQAMFASYGVAGAHFRAGRLHALGVTTTRRSKAMPELPTIAEAGVPGYDSGVWYGLLAPRGTPRPIIDRLNKEVVFLLKSGDVGERLTAVGLDIVGSTPEELAAYIKREIPKWADVVKRSGAKID